MKNCDVLKFLECLSKTKLHFISFVSEYCKYIVHVYINTLEHH